MVKIMIVVYIRKILNSTGKVLKFSGKNQDFNLYWEYFNFDW